ncbi:Nucleic-acid-binding protein from transposon X-element [Eumeta japonica]|uniref:Nucleic-acid-binding protein from transposon X-element n=1 Tax=Eumeta variegata TaxID=151549 RepID=A0A4C1XVN3_EUMVA|nr:Nucleic-acid-binding protein from transposon X-element [Eumeta japonica]
MSTTKGSRTAHDTASSRVLEFTNLEPLRSHGRFNNYAKLIKSHNSHSTAGRPPSWRISRRPSARCRGHISRSSTGIQWVTTAPGTAKAGGTASASKTVEAPYKRGIPGQCYRCQLYGHAATNCHAPPRCVKCLDPHWTKECTRTRDSEGKPACCNCGSDHTANYGGCPAAPKPKPKSSHNKNITKVQQTSRPLDVSHFPALNSGNKQTARTVPAKPTGSKNFHPMEYSVRSAGRPHIGGRKARRRKKHVNKSISILHLPTLGP